MQHTVRDFCLRRDELGYKSRSSGNLLGGSHYRVIDLFSGAGGMSLGFSPWFGQPFQSVWANDFNADAAATYSSNFEQDCVHGDIISILESPDTAIPVADVVIGGPPCQGFSLLNKNRLDDPRKQMWRPFFDVVSRSGAYVFVMENVPQLLSSNEYQLIKEKAHELGFFVYSTKLLAADYGVPQKRLRAFIIGCRFFDPRTLAPIRKTHFDPNQKRANDFPFLSNISNEFLDGAEPWRTVRNAIEDLPKPEGTEIKDTDPPLDIHFGRKPTPLSMKRYQTIPEEGMNRFDLQKKAPELTPACWIRKKSGGTDLFGRLWWDRPAFTIRTEFFKPEKGRYLHPRQNRPITHREAARFQSFPDNFVFRGSKIEIARQIGNAVPPLLAARVADMVRVMLEAREDFGEEMLRNLFTSN